MLRDLKHNAVQFFSIFIMCFLALFMLASFVANRQGFMENTDKYYKATNFLDLCLLSEGFTQEDLNDLERLPDVKRAERRATVTGKITSHDNKKIELNFIESNDICRLYTVNGEDFERGKKGLWIDWFFAGENGISVGDSLEIECNGKTFTEPVNGIIGDSDHLHYIIDESFADVSYDEYCYAFLDTSEYPFDDISFEKVLIDLVSVDDQMYLDENDKEGMRSAKLNILDNFSKASLRVGLKNEQEGFQAVMTSANFDKVIITVFPPLFILLAILCTITTMARLTARQRTVIGTLKALGFSKATVIVHYNMYSVVISAAGSILGAVAGHYIFGKWLFEDYEELFTSPIRSMETSFLVPGAIIIIVILTGLSNFLSCRKLLVLNASEILKPDAPKVTNAGPLEKTFVWKKLSFASRWNLRDMNINRGRTIMAMVGVALCSSLLMASFGAMEIFSIQEGWIFNKLKPAEYTISLASDSGFSRAYDHARKFEGQMVMTTDVEISKGKNSRLYSVTVVDDGNLYRFQDENGGFLDVPENGALLSAKAAKALKADRGDNISFRLPGQKKEYTIYVAGLYTSPESQGIVLSRGCYERLGGYFEPSTIYTNMTVPKSYETTREEVTGVVSKKEYVHAYRKANENNNDMIYIIVVIAVVVGFVAMFNMGILSFMEKARDVATLKVLGFASGKIRWILQQQNLFLTGIGSVAGLPFGLVYLDNLMDKVDPTGDYLIKLSAKPYLLAVLFSFVVSAGVNGIISTRVNVINMVEALKGAE